MNEIEQIQDNQDNNGHIDIGYGFENQINKSDNVIHINVGKKYNEDIKRQQSKIDEED